MSETSELTGPLLKIYKEAGAMAYRMQCGRLRVRGGWMVFAEEGTADLLVFPRHGGVVWVETKDPTGKTAKERAEAQARFREKVEAMHHRYIRATTIDEGMEALR
jgi:hypothetical protein